MIEAIRRKTLFFYGITAIPLAMLGLPLYIYLPTFYAKEIGLGVTTVGILLFVARLSDVISDPLIGYYNDRYQSRFGRRKVFMSFGAIVLSIGFYALIHPDMTYPGIWLLAFTTLIYLGWSLVSIPYLAWSSEISPEYHQKTRLSASREMFTILGVVIALVLPYLYEVASRPAESLAMLFNAFVITLVIVLPLTLRNVDEPSRDIVLRTSRLSASWKSIPSLYRLQAAFSFNSLANALPATLFLFYVELVLDAPELTGALLLLYFVAGVAGLPLWSIVARRTGKKISWQGSMLLASAAFVFVPFLGSGDTFAFALITFISGLSLGADMALPASIQADVAQRLDEKDEAASGLLFGIWAMLTKLALALAVAIAFVTLGMVGFEPETPSEASIYTLSLLYGAAPVFFKLIAFVIMRGYDEEVSTRT